MTDLKVISKCRYENFDSECCPAKPRSLVEKTLQGEDIGVMIYGEIVAFRPVKVFSEDYANLDYGVTAEELDQFAQKVNKELDADRKADRLKPFTGKRPRA